MPSFLPPEAQEGGCRVLSAKLDDETSSDPAMPF